MPLFIFAASMFIAMFPMLQIQVQVNSGLQYTARMMAVSYRDSDDTASVITMAKGEYMFRTYMNEHGCAESVLKNGISSISLASSDLSDDYVILTASYETQLPVSLLNMSSLPVTQSVKMKKWTGASSGQDSEDTEYVYITPTGSAYHKTAECSYLKLSIKSVAFSEVSSLRNKSGGKYYPCSCYSGGTVVYITDYGTLYHSSLSCSGLKRTIYKVSIDEVGSRHACSKCY